MITAGTILDGYALERVIGRGGFGEVWLCRSVATRKWMALKWIPARDTEMLERELEAVKRYNAASADLQSPHLVPIQHVNRCTEGLFYTMPLADGMDGGDPAKSSWVPKTLAAVIHARKSAPAWFGAAEIVAILAPLIRAVAQLNAAGVVHRDIKPENILFINGAPCLGDMGLLTEDAAVISRRGTPGYSAPSWYLESGGNPDPWGLATTLYALLTGNNPDKVGRAAFLYPPQGQASVDEAAWDHYHRVILRAMHAEPGERFLRLADLESAIREPLSAGQEQTDVSSKSNPGTPPLGQRRATQLPQLALVVSLAVLLLVGGFVFFGVSRGHSANTKTPDDARLSRLLLDQGGRWEFFTAPMQGVSTIFHADGTYQATIYAKEFTTQERGTWKIIDGTLIETPDPSVEGHHRVSATRITRLEPDLFEGTEKGETIRMFRPVAGGEGD